MAIADLYNITFDVYRLTSAQDVIGGQGGSFAAVSTGNKGRICKLSGTEREYAGRQGVMSTHELFSDVSVDITEADRVVYDVHTYDVQYIYNVDEMGHHLEVIMALRE